MILCRVYYDLSVYQSVTYVKRAWSSFDQGIVMYTSLLFTVLNCLHSQGSRMDVARTLLVERLANSRLIFANFRKIFPLFLVILYMLSFSFIDIPELT